MKNIFICFFVFFSTISFAQFSINGRVKADSSVIDLPKVAVSIPELNLFAVTDNSGVFKFDNVQEGVYTIMFKLNGYKTFITTINSKDSLDVGTILLKPGFIQIAEVVVYGANDVDPTKTANTIQQLNTIDIRNSGALNLSDGISKLPGVSQISTGVGISKPVIRGLFGNRIQTVLYGLRFDNQQWQDEHGLGLSDVGIDRVEIIKGPASLLYGSEAMGGVINIIEEKSPPINTTQIDLSSRFYSNTYGNATDIGVKRATKKFNWRIRAGMDSHADYSDGNNNRILNSRFGGYYAKASIGFNRKRWINQTNYMFTQSNFGFLMDPIQLLDPPDDRLSRSFDRPHHTVNLNIISSQNIFFLKRSRLKFNIGFQNNNRQEQEGGNKISLNMILNSYLGNLVWIRSFKKVDWSLGTQGYYQTNKNVGSRTIIPDAQQIENSLYSYLKFNFRKIIIEGGLRYDIRHIETYATGLINTDPSTPGSKIKPFKNNYNALNGSIGLSVFNNGPVNLKTNFSTGYRTGNLAELSSNGLHEGTVRYEIGNTDLKIEQNFCSDIYLGYSSKYINASASAYYNQFLNYIYLAPTGKQYIGFDIYNYVQQNAVIKGIEASIDLHPFKTTCFNWMNSYSYIIGTTKENNLPFIPAPKLNSDIKLTKKINKKITELSLKPGVQYVFLQNRPSEFETRTEAYYLLNASLSTVITNKKNTIHLSLVGNNLLNNAYYDHLSRFKYFGIYNIGRNISLNFKLSFI